MDFDWRLLIVFGPLIIAGSWAIYNILPAAIQQVQAFLNKET
jgi:photosystem II PsbY protein